MLTPHSNQFPAEPLFQEVQPLWRNTLIAVLLPVSFVTATALLWSVAFAGPPSQRAQLVSIWALLGVGELAVVTLFRLRTTVTPGRLSLVYSPLYWKDLDLAQVSEVESIRYNVLTETGGWGVRYTWKHGRVLNVAGDLGVRLVAGGKRYLIGTRRPDELIAALLAAGVRPEAVRDLPEQA